MHVFQLGSSVCNELKLYKLGTLDRSMFTFRFKSNELYENFFTFRPLSRILY